MRVQLKHIYTIAALLGLALAGNARAQINFPFGPSSYDHDLQIFAPLELDLDNLPGDETYGYFLGYERLAWSFTGERVTVGNPNVFQSAEQIYRQNSQDEGQNNLPPDLINNETGAPVPDGQYDTYQIENGLQDVPPQAGFGFGDRYTVGYRDGESGWVLQILDGPRLTQSEFYGFAPADNPAGGLPPFIDEDYTPANDQPPAALFAGFDLRAFGFGSVPMLFDTPTGYLKGFRDYLNLIAGATLGTQGGPYLYVGNYGISTEDDEVPVAFFRLADDIDEDGAPGAGIVFDQDMNIILIFTDFDDLHTFNVFFDNVTVRNITEVNGVELMWSHVLTNNSYMAKNQNNHLELFWGARFMRVLDAFRVDATGSVIGDSFWDTSINNQIVGPQVAMRWVNRRGRWTINTDARFMFGYSKQNWDQEGIMGQGMVPGALNRPFFGRPTAFARGRSTQEFAPVAELRLEARYHLTQSFALKIGYNGMFVGNIRRAATAVEYRLPDMGFLDSGTQDVVINGVNAGVEFVH